MKTLELAKKAVTRIAEVAVTQDQFDKWNSTKKRQWLKDHPTSKFGKKEAKPAGKQKPKELDDSAKKAAFKQEREGFEDFKEKLKSLHTWWEKLDDKLEKKKDAAQRKAFKSLKTDSVTTADEILSKDPEYKHLKTQKAQVGKKIDDLNDAKNAEIRTKMRKIAVPLKKANPELFAKNKENLGKKVTKLKETIKELQTKHDQLDKEYDKVRKTNTGLSRNRENDKLDSLAKRRDNLEIKISDLREQLADIQDQLSAHRG